MAAGELNFSDIATVVNGLMKEATGVNAAPQPIDYSSFVTQAQTLLKCGYDQVLNAISQVQARTIFAIRPYSGELWSMMRNMQQYGNHVRKLSEIDTDFKPDVYMDLTDGQWINQWEINKPKLVQTNFYGGQHFSMPRTRFLTQLNQAFMGPDELAQFWSMDSMHVGNMINQARETLRRGVCANYILAKSTADATSVYHLVDEYNAVKGTELTKADIWKPEHVKDFFEFVFSFMQTISDMMTSRSGVYQLQLDGKPINRHTPKANQKCYMLSRVKNQIATAVQANVFNERFLQYVTHETVNYFQNFHEPGTVQGTCTYIGADGNQRTSNPAKVTDIFAVLYDEEAMGVTNIRNRVDTTQMNARGEYWNTFYKWTDRWWNDLTEKGVIFCLNKAEDKVVEARHIENYDPIADAEQENIEMMKNASRAAKNLDKKFS